MSVDEIKAIALTAVDSLISVRDRCISAEGKCDALEELLEESQKIIEEKDLIINKSQDIDDNFIDKWNEASGFSSGDSRFLEIYDKKRQEIKNKQLDILRTKYNLSHKN